MKFGIYLECNTTTKPIKFNNRCYPWKCILSKIYSCFIFIVYIIHIHDDYILLYIMVTYYVAHQYWNLSHIEIFVVFNQNIFRLTKARNTLLKYLASLKMPECNISLVIIKIKFTILNDSMLYKINWKQHWTIEGDWTQKVK